MKNRLHVLFVSFTLLALTLACAITVPTPAALPDPNLAATNLALQVTIEALAAQFTSQAGAKLVEETIPPAPQDTQTPLVITATPEPTLPPTETSLPTDTPTPDITPTLNPVEQTRQLEARIKAANVLIYDEPDVPGRLVPRLSKAIAGMGFSGGAVVNTSNYLGNFDRLLRTQTWDLVVLSVENRSRTEIGSLGLLDPLSNHLARGGALVVETWNLDEDQSALAGLLLNVCSAHVEKDWHRAADYTYADFLIPAFKPDSPVFSTPYAINLPLRPTVFWPGDAGDLLRLDTTGSSQILAGVLSTDPNNYGVLTSCLNGRMILQTFSTHDYPLYETVHLWQNMMHYTLANSLSPTR
ncbi:MAG: hypothetical protein IT308_12630 [Anaerolineaceae bacterium]|nr:hypothetical protein [Anaerolineaceae bacterium]